MFIILELRSLGLVSGVSVSLVLFLWYYGPSDSHIVTTFYWTLLILRSLGLAYYFSPFDSCIGISVTLTCVFNWIFCFSRSHGLDNLLLTNFLTLDLIGLILVFFFSWISIRSVPQTRSLFFRCICLFLFTSQF